MKNKFSIAMPLAVVLAILLTSIGFAAELITAEVTGTANDVTVTQGTSVTSTINISANGSISCLITAASPSTATVDTSYSLGSSGALTTSSPSSAFKFYSDGVPQGGSGNCGVTWDTASTPYSVTATFSAASTTPVGDYTVTLQDSSAGTTDTADITNPAVSGGKLGDATATTITVHVISGAVVKTTPTITWSNPADIVYGTALSGTQLNATASVAGTFVYTPAAGAVLNAGLGQTLHVDFTPSDTTNYNSASKDVTINVLKANPGCNISGYSGVYDGNAHGASGTCTASGSLSLGASFTNVPGGTANWSFTSSSANYNNASGSVQITISKAPAGCSISGFTGKYDGDPHGASGSCTGGSTLDLGASFTNVPGGTAYWSFTGDGNHEDDSGSVAISISKADATIVVSGYTGVYDGAAHGATGSATGVKGEALSGLDLGGSFTNVPGGTANWAFTDVTGNYNNASGTAAIVINKANALISVSGFTGTYDGLAHGATGTSTGVNGEDLSAGLDLGASFTDVSGGTANWTFAGGTNYNNANGTAPIVINKATLTVTADNKSIVFGQALPSFTFQYSGFVNQETSSVVDTAPTCGVGQIPMYGSYAISCSGGSDNNYQFNYVNGTLTVQAWTFGGFYQPVDMGGVYNTVKNGSTVPLKFEVFAGGVEQTATTAIKSFVQTKIACDGTSPVDDIEFVTTGGTSLRYDATAGQFVQNWQTPKIVGACYRVTMTTQDGSTLQALFKLK